MFQSENTFPKSIPFSRIALTWVLLLAPHVLASEPNCAERELSFSSEVVLALDSAKIIEASHTQRLKDLAEISATLLREGNSRPLPTPLNDEIWKGVENLLAKYTLPNGHQPSVALFKKRIRAIYDTLQKQNKIRLLSTEDVARLGLKEYLCNDGTQACKELRGFYVPTTGDIFIDAAPIEALTRTVFHELIHAYQYTYRFPIDLKTVSEAARKGLISKEQSLEFLNYFYESQANYQTMRISPDPDWSSFYRSAGNATAIQIGKFLFLAALPVNGIFQFGAMMAGNAIMNAKLPEIAKVPIIAGTTLSGPTAAYIIPELVLLNDSSNFTSIVSLDLDFHKKYGKAVERTYFGEVPFLFQHDRNDLELSNELHNRYYERIGLSGEIEEEPHCDQLLSYVQGTDIGPMVQWLSIPAKDIEACAVYQGAGDDAMREAHAKNILTQSAPNSPFLLIRPAGGDGSRPDFKISPPIGMQPQLKISPPEEE